MPSSRSLQRLNPIILDYVIGLKYHSNAGSCYPK